MRPDGKHTPRTSGESGVSARKLAGQRRIETQSLECDQCLQSLYMQGLVTDLLKDRTNAPRRTVPWFRRSWTPAAMGTAAAAVAAVLGLRLMLPVEEPEGTGVPRRRPFRS